MLGLFQAVALIIVPVGAGDTCYIDCRSTPTSVGGFSLEFQESCSIPPGAFSLASNSPDSNDFFEFIVTRVGATPSKVIEYIGQCTDLQGANYFKYLNTIKTSLFINKEYSNTCESPAFVPDDSYIPLPITRPQKCVFGARLVEPLPGKFGALFPEPKQVVAFGFDTTFRFVVSSKSQYCQVLQQQPAQGAARKCTSKGGRGFAFVIQNAGSPGDPLGNGDLISYQINVATSVNFGYNFPQNVAIEFDYFFDPNTNDPNWNHVAVMVPNSRNAFEAKSNSNSADHSQNMLAIADSVSLPPLDEGIHKVQIIYDVSSSENLWQDMISNQWLMRPLTQFQQQMLTWWSYGRIGTLTVLLDDVPIIKTFLDIGDAVQVDPISAPNPGSAWVGFVASTGPTADQVASPIIVSWTWSSFPSACENPTPTLSCLFGHKVADISTTTPRSGGESDVQFFIRNIARSNLKLFASLAGGGTQRTCSGASTLAWNQIHPYYAGCSYPIAVGPNLDSLVITDESGSRSVTVDDPQLINRDFQSSLFIRQSTPEYCVIEHQSDYYKLFFGQCNCAYCVRIFDNQRLYSVFYNEICSQRYTFSCKCFEVSQMTQTAFETDYQTPANPWITLTQPTSPTISAQLMQYQEHTVCRGCSFDYHCNFMLPTATCDTPTTIYRIGNPLEPTPGGSFQNWNRGKGAEDGIIKGNACNCLDRVYEPEYLNSRNQQVHISAYLTAYLPKTADDCLTRLKIGGDASEDCGYPVSVNLLHYPNGQACSTCTLASLALMNIPTLRYTALRDCVYSAIKDGLSPWSQCETTVGQWNDVPNAQSSPQTVLYDLLNGIATHFLTECPSADFKVRGAVCAPNLYAVGHLPMQMITSQSANAQRQDGSYPIWWDGVACMNAMCQLTPKSACYKKLIKILFRKDPVTQATTCYDLLGSSVTCTLNNAPGYDPVTKSVILDRSAEQFGYTSGLPVGSWSLSGGLKSKTLEVWAKVDPADVVDDLVATNVNGLVATNSWGDDYVPSQATSLKDLSTYWHSQTSTDAEFRAVWEINFGPVAVRTVQSITLIFHELPPASFTVEASVDGANTWKVVSTFTNNNLLTISSSTFFKFNAIRLVMTKAFATRTYGIDSGKYAYAISGFGAFSDLEVSRLKPTQASQHYTYSADLAFDNSYSSWWSVPRRPDSIAQGWISLSFGNIQDVVLIRLVYRLGFNPSTIATTVGINGGPLGAIVCQTQNIACISGSVSVGSVETQFSMNPTVLSAVRVDITGGTSYYDDSIVQISEIEIFNAPSGSPTTYSPSTCGGIACVFPLTLSGPTIQQFTVWQIPDGSPFGIFVITLTTYSGTGPATISIRSPNSYTAISTLQLLPIGTLSFSFSSLIQKNSDLTIIMTVPAGTVITVASITVSALTKIDISSLSPTVTTSSSWIDNIAPISSVSASAATSAQGIPNNMFDANRWTEFRTKIGAPSFLNSIGSSDPDFVLTTNINRVINIDAIFLSFSFRSRWFRFRTKSLASPKIPDAVCEWTPGTSLTTGSGCANSVMNVLPNVNLGGSAWKNTSPYGYVFSQNPLGKNLPTNTFDLTLMQSSAIDTVGNNQPIIGIRELGIYSAYETVVPVRCAISSTFQSGNGQFSPSACQSTLFDKNFATSYSATSVAAGNYYLDFDLGAPYQLKDFTVYWALGSSNSVPTQIRIYSSNTATTSTCDVSATDSTASDFSYLISSPTDPVVYADPSGYIERPVRCFRISFDSIPSSGHISIAEVSIRVAEPSFGATIVSSSLTNPSYALDPVSVSAATANGVTGTLNHYIMMDLKPPKTYPPGKTASTISPDVWGLYMVFTNTGLLDKASIKIYVCNPSAGSGTFSDCTSDTQTLSVSVPFNTVTSTTGFVFGPLNCLGCTRVAITFNALAGASGTSMFGIGTINVFASFNQALFGGITAALAAGDTRGWDYTPEKAVDGDSTTAWVSEPDVNSAELVVSLIPEGPTYDPLSATYIATQSSLVSPTHVATITVNFLYPMIEFAIDTSTDGVAWTERLHTTDLSGVVSGNVGTLLYANYIRVRLIRSYPVQSPLSLTNSAQSTWFSTLMGVTSVTATTLTNLATGAVISAVGSVNTATQYGINSGRWMTMPPGPIIGQFFLTANPLVGIDVSGIEVQWYHPPASFVVTWIDKNGQESSLSLQTRTATAPLTGVYGVTQFLPQVASLKIQISNFASLDGIAMALMKQIVVYKPNTAAQISVQSLSASTSTNSGYLIDQNLATVWTNLGTPSFATITLAGGNNLVSTITIVWGQNICSDFDVLGKPVGAGTFTTIASFTGNTMQSVTIRLLSSYQQISVDMFSNVGGGTLPLFTVAEISVYGAVITPIVSGTQLMGSSPTFDSPDFAIDSDTSNSMWMVSPVFNYLASSATITVTLGTVYKASAIQVLWGWTPWDPTTLNIANQLRQYVVFTDNACSYSNPLNYEHIELGFSIVGKTDTYSNSVFLKCLSIIFVSGAPYFGGSVLGPSIKDISITLDQNLIQGQQQYVDDTQAGGWWDFPANRMADGSTTTAWLSKKQSTSAEIRLDLGQVYNLAGIDITFLYPAGVITYYYSQQSCASTTTFTIAAGPVANNVMSASLSGLEVQFVARCVRIVFQNPLNSIPNPDSVGGQPVTVFGVTQFYVYHMVGGGGVFGIEARNPTTGVWGTIFDSIAFGPYQPNQWHMLSEAQIRSQNVNGPFIMDETQNMVQIVATFSSNTVTLYRNGVMYGSSYSSTGLVDWSTIGDVRLVFGLASSQFASPATQSDINTVLGSPPKKPFTLNPYFAGSIQSMTLLSQALSAEEVMGLYLAQSDYTKERACHCYDACPTGYNQFYPTVPVPCSGQGVCLRQYDQTTGLPATPAGVCQCSPGFSGNNCAIHCSDAGGCCTVNDDCPIGTTCNTFTNYCQ